MNKPELPLRVTSNRDEIVSIFKEASKQRIKVTLWQNIDGKRIIFNGVFKTTNLENNSVVLDIENPQNIQFKNRVTIYLKGNFKNILFKENLTFGSNRIVIFSIPKEIRVHELRENPRLNFRSSDNKMISFTKLNPYTNQKENFDNKLIDLSEEGLAFLADSHQVTQFNNNDELFIKKISDVNFDGVIVGKISHMKNLRINVQQKSIQAYRVGVKFTKRLKVFPAI